MIHVFTSAAINYISKVQTLFESIRAHHPEFIIHFLVAEDQTATPIAHRELLSRLNVAVTYANDLPQVNRKGWLFSYSLVELATAIKPLFAQKLLERDDCDFVFYLDPDTVLFSRLDDVVEQLSLGSIALTPHLLSPETSPTGIEENEICALKHGAFNLGFLGLRNTPQARAFVKWWGDRTYSYCSSDTRTGLFTDQKWIDLVPAFFNDHVILRSTRLNVAPWNISQRVVSGSFDQGFLVDACPLGFYHFTGFDSGAHQRAISRYAPNNPSLQMLVDWYKHRTAALNPGFMIPWSLGNYDNDRLVSSKHRVVYRQRADLQEAFPNPFETAGRSYFSWLASYGVKEYGQDIIT